MTRILLRPAAPQSPIRPQPRATAPPPSPVGRGAVALIVLALLAGVASQMPYRGDVLGILTGVAGSLAVSGIIAQPERRPFLSLSWSAMGFALPVTLTLAHPGLALGLSLTLGAVGLWVILALAARRRLPNV